MALAIWSRFLRVCRKGVSRRGRAPVHSVRRRPASALPGFEVLEDRVTPSGGPGPSGGSGGSSGSSGGGGPGPSGSAAIVSTSSGALVTGSSGKTYTLSSLVKALGD